MKSKRIREGIAFLLAFAMILGCVSVPGIGTVTAKAAGADFSYDEATKTLTVYTNEGTTSWHSDANVGTMKREMTTVKVMEGVTEIGEMAFQFCGAITEVELPDGLTEIGEKAFQYCEAITEVELPDGLTEIESRAFQKCSKLTEIKLPDSIMTIGERALSNCAELRRITIPKNVTKISWGMFEANLKLEEVTLPEGISEIEGYAFSDCGSLKTITLPKSVNKIGKNAFGSSGLTSIEIPDAVTTIEDNAFSGCIGLTSIEIPDLVNSIGKRAFSGCSNLMEVKVDGKTPAKLMDTSTGSSGVFYGCGFYKADGEEKKGIKVFSDVYNTYCTEWSDWKEYIAEIERTDTDKLDEAVRVTKRVLASEEPTNATSGSAIVAKITDAVNDLEYNIKVSAEPEELFMTEATKEAPGSITGTITLTLDSASKDVKVDLVIPKLPKTDDDKLNEAEQAARAALEAMTPDNNTEEATVLEAVKEEVDKLGYGVEVTLSDFEKVDATTSNPGSVTGTIVLKLNEAKREVPVELVIEKLSGGSGSGGSGNGGSGNSGSGNGGTVITVPVTGDKNTVNVTAKVENSTAVVDTIKTEDINKLVAQAEKETKVEVDLTGLNKKIDTVILPNKSMEEVARAAADKTNKVEGLTVKLTTATVELDSTALSAVVEQAKGDNIQLNVDDAGTSRLNEAHKAGVEKLDVHAGIEAYFTCNGQRIGDFKGGEATVKIPFAIPQGYKAAGFSVWYVADNGKTTKYESTYKEGHLVFTVDHFSDFLIVYDEADAQKAESTDNKEIVKVDTTFRKLRLKSTKSTKDTNKLVWGKVADADGYVVYGAQCNTKAKTYKITKLAVIKDGSTTTWTDRDLKSGTYYKYYVKAYKLVDGKKVFIAKSKTIHVTTTDGKYGNAKSVKVNDTDVTLKAGNTFTIKVSQVKADKAIQKHTAIKYESSNSKVATVSSKGVITAKKKGTCYVYVYAQNGIYAKVKVTVR